MSNCYDIEYKDNYFDQCTAINPAPYAQEIKGNYKRTTVEDVKISKKKFKEFSDGVLERFDEIIENFEEEYNACYETNEVWSVDKGKWISLD